MHADGGIAGPDLGLALVRERRVLVFADLVESVRLMNRHESAVITRWLHFLGRVQAELLPALGGRLVKSHGDGLLLEFAEVPHAVQAAFQLHRLIAGGAREDDEPLQMQLRIGVHLADVVVQPLDLFGAGVNLAARLAGLAGAGEIVVSTEVRDLLSDQPDWHLVDLGECFLKHFDQPVRAYRIGAGAAPALGCIDATDHRPALAVLPLKPRPGMAPDDVVGEAIADDVIGALSRLSSLRLISRLSTRRIGDSPATLAQIGRLLDVAYVLAGRYRRRGARVEVSVELADTRTGAVLWAETLEAALDDIFHGQDQLVPTVAREVAQRVLRAELERSRRLPIATLDGYTLYLGGVVMLHRLAQQDFVRAHELLEHLSGRHPKSAAPHAMLAKWYVLQLAQGWASDRTAAGQRAQHHARRALELDPDHALALSMQAAALAHTGGDLEEVRALSERATEADPQEPHAWLTLGAAHSWLGDGAPAEALPQRAVALSPIDPARFLFDVFVAVGKLATGKHAEAVEAAQASIRLNAMHPASHRLLTIALALDGRMDEARAAARRLMRVDPGFRVSAYQRSYAGGDRPHARERARALLAAGVPP